MSDSIKDIINTLSAEQKKVCYALIDQAIHEEPVKAKTYNCPNCGAPITSWNCEYCGTVFEDKRRDIELAKAKLRIIEEQIHMEELYDNAIRAMRSYERL